MKRIFLRIMATTLFLSSLLSFTSLAGWEQSEQGWKYKDDNTQQYVTVRWVESTSEAGLWYYINDDGIMATNAWIDDVYYVNEAGEWRTENHDTDKNSQGVGWNEDGTFNWGDGGASENITSGGPISESEKASGRNFLNHR